MDSASGNPCTSPNALQILISAREVIRDPAYWTQEVEARTATGEKVSPLSDSAVCFCAGGAVVRVAKGYTNGGQFAITSLDACAHTYYQCGLAKVNDTKGHRAIMHVFDEAIQMLSPKA